MCISMFLLKFFLNSKSHFSQSKHRDQRIRQEGVAVAYRRWSFTRGSNCKASTGKLFLFWIGGRLWEVRYIFTSCHSLSLKMDLSKERPWESYEQTPLKQRLRKYFRFQKALDRQRLATQFWKKNCYQKSHRTQRREGHVPKIKKTTTTRKKRNISWHNTSEL